MNKSVNGPFKPSYGSGQTVTAGASAQVDISAVDEQVCITNTGSAVAHVRIGTNPTATAADYPIQAGAQVVISKGSEVKLASFCATSTTLHIMTGKGW